MMVTTSRFCADLGCSFYQPTTESRKKADNLDDALGDWQVDEPGMWENDTGPEGWWAVSNADEAIIAYFAKPEDAYRWRLDVINRDLNP